MIRLHAISLENEMPVAERLKTFIGQAWPGVADSEGDHIDILVGVRSPVDVDILVVVELRSPRAVPPQRRRAGGLSPAVLVQCALIAIEVKQLDADRFSCLGNQWFPHYGPAAEKRSVAVQARDAAFGVSKFARQSGFDPFVFGVAWLTEVDETMLKEIEPTVLGREATWFTILDAAMQQSTALAQLGSPAASLAMQTVRNRLLNRRKGSNRDLVRVERLSRDLASRDVVDALVERCGSSQLRLIGRGGSGKTTSLALLAVRLAEGGERVLVLTFHRALRTDIARLVETLAERAGIRAGRIHVETVTSFVLSALASLGAEPPMNDAGVDYASLDRVLDETRGMLCGTPESNDGDVARLRAGNPERFAWDHVFIDEAQDCTDSERDFLRGLYGHRRFVLADGVDQLIRRQVACDWNTGIPSPERSTHRLDASLRMLRNVATFANCMARAMGLDTWRITPDEDLPGGRVIVATGDAISPEVLSAVVRAAADNKAEAVDCLICLPPKSGDDDRLSRIVAAAQTAGIPIWNGTVAQTRDTATAQADALRLVRYDSCRGLEGWITLALDVDDLVKNKLRYPNLNPNDPPIAADVVANRWMMMPLTRAVHTLIVTVRDPNSVTAQQLRDATADPAMPRGVVEWVKASDLAATLAPPAVVK